MSRLCSLQGRLSASLLILLCLQISASAQEFSDCAAEGPAVPPVTISRQMLNDVCIQGNPINPILYFDDYSWRSFLALVWPAAQGQRGRPDSTLPLGAVSQPTVFETFKAEWELFQPSGRDPVGWNEYGGRENNPYALEQVDFGGVLLSAFRKFDNVVQAGSPQGALIAQNGTYVRHSTAFNEKSFQHIVNGKYYLREMIGGGVAPFPDGAISVKSAWIDLQNVAAPERFFSRDAWLFNLATEQCERKKVGLVGLHIVAKTPTRPQWIWSTFEHIDNVPGPQANAPFTFNNGDGTPMPASIPDQAKCPSGECPLPPPQPYNVERVKPIHDRGAYSTQATNAKYRAALAQQYPDAPWKNYQLVMTQWPIAASRPDLDAGPDHTFPGTALDPFDATAFSNTTLETFKQTDVSRGCMGCHNHAKAADLVFTLMTRAYPRSQPALPPPHLNILNDVGKLLDVMNAE
jgi:hypothetical protein